ncbi:MAG: RDD family protein [Deltaproteobacteria bacterium]
MTQDSPERRFDYAGFWVRAAARVIDLLLILGVFNLFFLLDRYGARAGWWTGGEYSDRLVPEGFSPAQVMRGIFFLGFPIFYYVYLHGAFGQTFGKMALRIRVVNEDGTPISYGKALARWFGYLLCDLTLYVGYFWAAFDARKQGLHDRICRTIVVRSKPDPPRLTGGEPPQ